MADRLRLGRSNLSPAERSARKVRRRFARRQWSRRWLRLRPILTILGLVAVAGVAVWLLWFSSLLAVHKVVVTGAVPAPPGGRTPLTASMVRQAAAVPLDSPLIGVDLGKVHDRVASLAPVESVEVSRRWPDQILIEVTERTAIAVIDLGGDLKGLDREGVVFQSYRKAPADLPKVVSPAGTDAAALREAARVVAAMPPELAKITDHVEVASADEITLALSKGRRVIWGSSTDSAQKAQVLMALLSHEASVYDVSVPGQPTTR